MVIKRLLIYIHSLILHCHIHSLIQWFFSKYFSIYFSSRPVATYSVPLITQFLVLSLSILTTLICTTPFEHKATHTDWLCDTIYCVYTVHTITLHVQYHQCIHQLYKHHVHIQHQAHSSSGSHTNNSGTPIKHYKS